jgi:prevent-host-death family protein
MFNNSYSLSEISDIITSLPDRFEQEPGVITVTQNGKPVMTILPASTLRELLETIESLEETLEVLQDKELMASFRRGVQEMNDGKGIPWEEVKREMGWE